MVNLIECTRKCTETHELFPYTSDRCLRNITTFLSCSPKTLRLNARCADSFDSALFWTRQHGLSEVTTNPPNEINLRSRPMSSFFSLYYSLFVPQSIDTALLSSLEKNEFRVSSVQLPCRKRSLYPDLCPAPLQPISFALAVRSNSILYDFPQRCRNLFTLCYRETCSACMLARSHGIGSWCGSRS